jgi:CDGSH-type Zn-finger protein
MSNETPIIAQKGPFPVEVTEGKTYFWCACGRSQNQPFCDGSHKGTAFQPQKWTADKDGRAFFCGCKASQTQPLCDGSHSRL